MPQVTALVARAKAYSDREGKPLLPSHVWRTFGSLSRRSIHFAGMALGVIVGGGPPAWAARPAGAGAFALAPSVAARFCRSNTLVGSKNVSLHGIGLFGSFRWRVPGSRMTRARSLT